MLFDFCEFVSVSFFHRFFSPFFWCCCTSNTTAHILHGCSSVWCLYWRSEDKSTYCALVVQLQFNLLHKESYKTIKTWTYSISRLSVMNRNISYTLSVIDWHQPLTTTSTKKHHRETTHLWHHHHHTNCSIISTLTKNFQNSNTGRHKENVPLRPWSLGWLGRCGKTPTLWWIM